ncbi:periplasmic chaperone for outer membrane proteins Skp [Mesonia phycicola]|uniref:Periplasmic chaperone for outer membrane proteins Skp n=1 Tax=Mesonia phycicola TaxID=579105 RepID=A0A1M6D3A5_9FLAO|nr:OmpH family outer membrane protein [Mesonia phycicola]SHI67726.1 periplasmic chaperone for outer membrane proteins Skp [Mesonia phycicola]
MKKIAVVILGAITLASCNQEQEKTAYVDNTVLIQDFKEMKETEAYFNERSEKLQKSLDSVALAFQKEVQDYQSQSASMSSSQRQEQEQMLMQKQQVLSRQQQVQSGQLREESDKIIDSLITKVKDFVADYGKEKGYTYIFGSNESANIMYAKEGKDITTEVLSALNSKYGGSEATLEEASTEK